MLEPSEKQLRQFGLMMAGVLSLFCGVFFYKNWIIAASVLGVLILFFGGMGLVVPMGLLPVHKKWMAFAEVIGNFNAKVILSLAYFLVFTPIRLVASLFREDPLRRKIEPQKETYWLDCEPRDPDPKRYEKQF
ncbi:MAG: SxtJ family membrane protein [Nitrospinota bacterium]